MTHAAVDTLPATPGESTEVQSAAGRTDLGTISVGERVVSKIAARAAVEVPDAGAAAMRVLGRTVPGAGHLGVRGTDLDGLPKTSADVDGTKAFIEMELSIRWPASIPEVTGRVRTTVRDRVSELTGLSVDEVRISVGDLVTHISAPPRVQ
jgi:uncharacterized alkaline shock family protein YloU